MIARPRGNEPSVATRGEARRFRPGGLFLSRSRRGLSESRRLLGRDGLTFRSDLQSVAIGASDVDRRSGY
jgi:hypothetical protein